MQKQIPTWDELLESIETAASHQHDTGWNIYHYLNANYKTLGSAECRSLLAIYLKIKMVVPSLLHSCILSVALKMADFYSDFKFPSFLELWGYPKYLRQEDMEKQKGKDGRMYLSLKERVDRKLESYKLHNSETRDEDDESIITMYAVKVFETERNGRKMRSVKLIGADGAELLADSHIFPCKPWEIAGRLFDVLIRRSKEGVARAHELVLSKKKMQDLFAPVVGYVESYDASHGHYHVFDNLSRHFVAEKPTVALNVGTFVSFAPIIPKVDKFKSAYVYNILDSKKGMEDFGIYRAVVKYVNEEKGYFYYKLKQMPRETPEGKYTDEGSAQLSIVEGNKSLTVGQEIGLLLFLTRGKDRVKHNHVVKVIFN